MTLKMFIVLSLSVFLFFYMYVMARASGHDTGTLSSPAFLIVGTDNGKILRCPIDNPENCETFHKGEEGTCVSSIVVHGEYLYVVLDYQKILRCNWNRIFSCTVYHNKTEYSIVTLTVSDGYLYAGGGTDDRRGVVLLCKLNRPNSCFLFQEFPYVVRGIFELNKHMYIATLNSLLCCSKGKKFSCANVRVNEDLPLLFSVSYLGNTIITISGRDSYVRFYNLTSGDSMNYVQKKQLNLTFRVTVLQRNVYVLKLFPYTGIEISQNYSDFKWFAESNNAYSMSFAYATHRIHHNQYEVSRCFEQSSPSDLFNYYVEHRAIMEVKVVDGRLRDARDVLVDTRRADRGYSGPAAIFAMGPDGQLLLSNAHRSGLVHITSLFADNPVAGAGEIVVEDGVVKRIIACSVSYWPDIKLNKQVVDELYRKGYEKADEIKLEVCDYTCDRN